MMPTITLSDGLMAMPSGMRRWREMLKLHLRARVQQRQTRLWLQLLNSHPVFHDLVQAYPHMIHKVYRPYLSLTLNCSARGLLAEHPFHRAARLGQADEPAAHGP